MGTTILPQTFTGKFDEMNQQLVKIANAQSTASGGIADAVNLANQATQSAEAKIVDVESRFNTLTSAQQGDSEVVDARKGEVSLRAKIDKIDTAHIAHVADKATQTELGHVKVDGITIAVNEGVISSNSLEVIKEFVVKSSESVTADDVVAFVNGGLKTAKTTIGTTITSGTPVVFESASSEYFSATTLSSDKVLVAYADGGNSYYGTAAVLSMALDIDKEIIGIAKETKSAGENCKVSLGPITTGLSGLTAGNIYYMDTDGTLCTTKKDIKIGVAISTTELRQTIQEL